jgi:hypothetical protein
VLADVPRGRPRRRRQPRAEHHRVQDGDAAEAYPFEGGACIGTGFFELVLERIDTSKLSDLR